jgi:histidinol-phosphatase (PHP family)
MEECIETAKKRNLNEIGFSEHILFHYVKDYPCMSLQRVPAYINKFNMVKAKTDFPIKLGVEIDFFVDDVEKTREFIQKYRFDYVIGAVHFIGNWGVDYSPHIHEYSKRDLLTIYEDYFDGVKKLCECKLFDILAHPDLIKIFGFKPKNDFSNILIETSEAIAKSNICVEINTRGLRKPCAEIYPSKEFLSRLHTYDVPIVFGSDAHSPDEVGNNFDEALRLAKRTGYNYCCTFSGRERECIRI